MLKQLLTSHPFPSITFKELQFWNIRLMFRIFFRFQFVVLRTLNLLHPLNVPLMIVADDRSHPPVSSCFRELQFWNVQVMVKILLVFQPSVSNISSDVQLLNVEFILVMFSVFHPLIFNVFKARQFWNVQYKLVTLDISKFLKSALSKFVRFAYPFCSPTVDSPNHHARVLGRITSFTSMFFIFEAYSDFNQGVVAYSFPLSSFVAYP